MIATPRGPTPIEQLKIGDPITAYCRHSSCFIGRHQPGPRVRSITRRSSAAFSLLRAGKHDVAVTPDQSCLIRYPERTTDAWVVYLMQRGEDFRVGWCQLFGFGGILHLGFRTRIELAEHAWVLSLHREKASASLEECFVATKYGIPQIVFQQNTCMKNLIYTQPRLDAFFERLVENDIILRPRAEACLADHGRALAHPFYAGVSGTGRRQGRTTISAQQVCNILPEIMATVTYQEGTREPCWDKISYTNGAGSAMGFKLDVDADIYIANNIVMCTNLQPGPETDKRALRRNQK